MMLTIAFSIIIPHKNIPDLLQRCLDSIPIREDIQVIVVDDNSSPDIVDFDHFPMWKGMNYEYYLTKTGKGAGYARNVGLSKAKGEWVLFADSDDIFTEQITEILDLIKSDINSDIIYFDVISRDSETMRQTDESEWFSAKIRHIAENGITDSTKYSLLTPWAKAIRRSLIEDHSILFEEVKCSNDTAFSAKISFYANEVSVILIPGYCWMFRHESLWHNKDLSWYVMRMQVSARLSRFMRAHNDSAGFNFFSSSAESYLESISEISKIEYLKSLCWCGWHMRDFKKIYKKFPLKTYHFAKVKFLSMVKRGRV